MNAIQNIHIGSIIKKVLAEKAMTISEFADKINCTRQNVYAIFQRKSVDIELLINISKVLDYEFIKEYYPDITTSENPTILVAIEVKKNEIEKLALSEEFIRLCKHEK